MSGDGSGPYRSAAEVLREGHRASHPDCRWGDQAHYVPPSMGEPGFHLCDAGVLEPPPPAPPVTAVQP